MAVEYAKELSWQPILDALAPSLANKMNRVVPSKADFPNQEDVRPIFEVGVVERASHGAALFWIPPNGLQTKVPNCPLSSHLVASSKLLISLRLS